jgi:hypothetical protein
MLLNALSLVWWHPPFYYPCPSGATDRVLPANAIYSELTEGIGLGRTDKNGYINPPEFAERGRHDVLLMGSSHMEAQFLWLDETAIAVLDKKLDGLNVYNIGTSGHSFLSCAQNLSNALRAFEPRYVILETSQLWWDRKKLELALENAMPRLPIYTQGLTYEVLERSPYIKLLYSQWQKQQAADEALELARTGQADAPPDNASPEQITVLLQQIGQVAREHNATPIVVFQQHLTICTDGTVTPGAPPEEVQRFANDCAEAGITFVDMTNRFLQAHADDRVTPHGFHNVKMGTGHLNAHGHRMVAEELARTIRGLERSRTGLAHAPQADRGATNHAGGKQ